MEVFDTKLNEYAELIEWFDVYYAQHEQKFRRLHILGLNTDEGIDPYEELIKLYNMAEIKRKQIQNMEIELKQLEEQFKQIESKEEEETL